VKILRTITPLAAILLASCASDSKPQAAAASPPKSLSQRLNESGGYKQDSEGNWKPTNDKRSSFESQGETYDSRKGYQKQTYKTGDYTKKSWWGNKEYDRKSYTGNTDGSRFQSTSNLQGKGAREANTNARIPGNYQTDNYQTNAARESGSSAIAKPSNDLTDNRQKVFQPPEIIDWREQRSLSMEQSKGILGR
jgi:hypothetical protein